MTTDPVCGMKVDEKTAPATSTYQGEKFYFCSDACKRSFDASPERFAKKPDFAGKAMK